MQFEVAIAISYARIFISQRATELFTTKIHRLPAGPPLGSNRGGYFGVKLPTRRWAFFRV